MTTYKEFYRRSIEQPDAFWGEQAQLIDWHKPPQKICDYSKPPFVKWFVGGETNLCYNAVDRHAAKRPDARALIYVSTETNQEKIYSFAELQCEVERMAAIFQSLGVVKGDRVLIYMPMIAEATFAILACARIGAIHSVVFGGFASGSLATRIDDAKPRLIVSADAGMRGGKSVPYKHLLDDAIKAAQFPPEKVLMVDRGLDKDFARVEGRDVDYATLRTKFMGAKVPCVWMESSEPSYILYTSGTTGKPKGVQRDTGGYAVALASSMKHIYTGFEGETYFATSDIGWVVGHSYIIYGPLIHGATSIMYEGKPIGTPDAGAFWRVISDYKAVALFTAPTAFRAIRKEDPEGEFIRKYDLSKFRTLFLAGERADPPTVEWAEQQLKVPVIDHWWQTETGWCIAGNPVGLGMLPVKHGSPTVPMPGYQVDVVDEATKPVPAGTMGSIVIKLPLPPGCLPTLWEQDERCREAYFNEFPGYYKTSDAGYKDEDGYVFVMGRTDDIINVAGHRLSTGGMEEILASHPDVAECAVLGIKDAIKGEVPCGFLVLKAGVTRSPIEIEKEIVALVREKLGPVAAFKLAITVGRLPKTRSGKILRGTIKKIADGDQWAMPATIEDPKVLDEIGDALKGRV